MQKTPHHESRTRVGIIFGGPSAEHVVSVQSAKNIIAALNTTQFELVIIALDRTGGWYMVQDRAILAELTAIDKNIVDYPGVSALTLTSLPSLIDVAFPVLHGPYGEDGTMQGLFELLNLAYVGCTVLGSAMGMDKDVSKRLLRDADIAVARHITIKKADRASLDVHAVTKELGLPLFVKPVNMGSSIGISKVTTAAELPAAIDEALRYDTEAIIEAAIIGDEIECAVLGNDQPRVSVPGRIIPSAQFYTYDAKYHDEDGTVLEIPAKIPDDVRERAQALALKVFTVLKCQGLARVDMFVTPQGKLYVNEINTMPGFTKYSMYPQLWEATGLSYAKLLTELISLAMLRFAK